MQVQEIMTQPGDTIDPSTTSREAARRMRDENIGALPVRENGELIGMVTDRDIVARAVAENSLPSNTAASGADHGRAPGEPPACAEPRSTAGRHHCHR